jgi:tripartite-type tricarboxylate transporter receptor subunit TctC
VPLSRRTLIHRATLAIGLLAFPAQAHAQSWPSRPIKLVVPTGPGAATDVMARLLSDGISRALGQTVVVENQAGASGILAHQTVARAAPDGYTFLFTNTSGMIFNKIQFKQLAYDPLRDFTPVASVCSQGPQMVSVNADVPAKSVPELISYAKANRGKLSIAFDVTAGAAGVATRLFNKRADIGLIEVPYRSAAQMAQDAASGVNPVLMSSIAAANAVVQAGKVRPLAITSAMRFPGLPDLPALNETLPGVVVDGGSASSHPPARRARSSRASIARSASSSRARRFSSV